MSDFEPKPRSPERLHMLNDMVARWDEDRGLLVTVTFRYEEWCCGEAHETVDAITAVYEMYEAALEMAYDARVAVINEELGYLREEIDSSSKYEQLTLF